MTSKGSLLLNLVNVNGVRPNDRVDLYLQHTESNHAIRLRDHRTGQGLRINELESTLGGTYRVYVFPMRHRVVSGFIQIKEARTVQKTFVLPVDPDRVSLAEFPPYTALPDEMKEILENSRVESYENVRGETLYQSLDSLRKAGLLNICAKMKSIRLPNGRNILSFVSSFTRIRSDRFFARVQKELRDEVKSSIPSRLFEEILGDLDTPPPAFTRAESFRTLESCGNLRLTLFVRPDTLDFIIDANLDEAQGIAQIFHAMLAGRLTHPYDIHQILVADQKIDPGYELHP